MMLWMGELIVINFILYPALRRQPDNLEQKQTLAIYRRIYNMSTMSVSIGAVTGIWLFAIRMKDADFSMYTTDWQFTIFISFVLGFVLGLLHVIEKVNIVRYRNNFRDGNLNIKLVLNRLKWLPRISGILVAIIMFLMLNLWVKFF